MNRPLRLAGCVTIAGLATSAPVHAITLADAVRLAYEHNPTLQAQRANLRILDEGFVQARAQLGATVSVGVEGDAQYARVDQPGSIFSAPSTLHAHARTATETASIVQPLWEGGQGAAAVDGARFDILAGREQLRDTEMQVLQQTIGAYDDVCRDQDLLEIAQATVKQLEQERSETQARFKEHVVTITDRSQAEARLEGAQANLTLAQARLDASRTVYVQVVGEDPTDLAAPEDLQGIPANVKQAFDAAEANSPTLRAARFSEESSRARVAQVRAANSATVSLRFDYARGPLEPYYQNLNQESFTARVTVNKPIYTSGLNASRLRAALEKDNIDRYGVDGARRDAIRAVSQAWAQMLSADAAVRSFSLQLKADQLAYDSIRQELRAGLRETIEVLNAEQELQAAKTQLTEARHDRHVAQAAVLAAAGLLDIASLSPAALVYRPELNFRKVSRETAPWAAVVEALDGTTLPKTKPYPLIDLGADARPRLSMPDAPPPR